MAEHQGFTLAETKTPAGDIRAVILWEIAWRCGQVPDLHPKLLEGIEVAARRLAAAQNDLLADAWDESHEATAEWAASNPGPNGPHDPPSNPYERP